MRRVELLILRVGDFLSNHIEGLGKGDAVGGMFIEVALFPPVFYGDLNRHRFVSEAHPETARLNSHQSHSDAIRELVRVRSRARDGRARQTRDEAPPGYSTLPNPTLNHGTILSVAIRARVICVVKYFSI